MRININDQLHLSPPETADIPQFVQLLNDPEVYQNTASIPFPYRDLDGYAFIRHSDKRAEEQGRPANWTIRTSDGLAIGGIGLMGRPGTPPHKEEVGYWLGKPYRGKGWMSEIVQVFTEHCFLHFGYVRLEALVLTHNPASARVLEKAGYQKEGLLRKNAYKDGRFLDLLMYARLHPDY